MRAADFGWLMTAIAKGADIELPATKDALLDALRAGGLARTAPDPGVERSHLTTLRAELARVVEARAASADPALVGRERGLRTAIVELSERLAESEGSAEIRRLSLGSPYRGGAGPSARWQLTQRGRVLLADLGPRSMRIGDATIEAFEAEMRALRDAFAWRAKRAAEIGAQLPAREFLAGARDAVPVGLSAVRADPQQTARAFEATFAALRRTSSGFTPAEDALSAECLCLSVTDLAELAQPELAHRFHALRTELRTQQTQHNEDAIDAAAILTMVPRAEHASRIAAARELAGELSRRSRRITLSLALTALAGDAGPPADRAHALAALDERLARDVSEPMERMAVTVLLACTRTDPAAQVERWRALRQYLARFAAEGMAIAAALLTWVALEPPEILDDLRLASAALSKHRMAGGGAETMTLAIKLLLSIAALAAGSEGDPEERLALAPSPVATLPHLGLAGALSALPIASAAVSTFHRTVLDAAAEWEQMFHPTHSSWVYGGGTRRSHGWG